MLIGSFRLKIEIGFKRETTIEISKDFLIENIEQPLLKLVEFVYPDFIQNLTEFFNDGAIPCPTTECVDQVNEFILSLIPEEEISYLSSDTPCQSDKQQKVQAEWFTS